MRLELSCGQHTLLLLLPSLGHTAGQKECRHCRVTEKSSTSGKGDRAITEMGMPLTREQTASADQRQRKGKVRQTLGRHPKLMTRGEVSAHKQLCLLLC